MYLYLAASIFLYFLLAYNSVLLLGFPPFFLVRYHRPVTEESLLAIPSSPSQLALSRTTILWYPLSCNNCPYALGTCGRCIQPHPSSVWRFFLPTSATRISERSMDSIRLFHTYNTAFNLDFLIYLCILFKSN